MEVLLLQALLSLLLVRFLAIALAYAANRRSGKYSPVCMAVLAAFLPEVYLLKAVIRTAAGDWSIPEIQGSSANDFLKALFGILTQVSLFRISVAESGAFPRDQSPIAVIVLVLQALLSLLLVRSSAIALAYTANRQSKYSHVCMAILADFLPEVYLLQAVIRTAAGDWSIPEMPLDASQGSSAKGFMKTLCDVLTQLALFGISVVDSSTRGRQHIGGKQSIQAIGGRQPIGGKRSIQPIGGRQPIGGGQPIGGKQSIQPIGKKQPIGGIRGRQPIAGSRVERERKPAEDLKWYQEQQAKIHQASARYQRRGRPTRHTSE